MKVRQETFTRPGKGGRRTIYVRAVDVNTESVILTRSTRTTKKSEAHDFIRALWASAEIEPAYRVKIEGVAAEISEADRLRALPLTAFVASFWSPESIYARALKNAGRPLSAFYLANSARAAELFLDPYKPFRRITLAAVSLFLIERSGFILVAFVHRFPTEGLRVPHLRAIWIPETGPRHPWIAWDHNRIPVDTSRFGPYSNRVDLMEPRPSAWGRAKLAAALREDFARAVSYEDGPGYEEYAMHLLKDGPDRRAAYLARRLRDAPEGLTLTSPSPPWASGFERRLSRHS